MSLVDQNRETISRISDKNSRNYIDLPYYYKEFRYPVSIELAEYVGRNAYQNEVLDPIGFLTILGTKIYSTIRTSGEASSLANFIDKEEPERFIEKSSDFIRNVKRWETGLIEDDGFSRIIEDFCLRTQGVRLPVISFFLRMLQPKRFGTLDIRATQALFTLGFKGVKKIPMIRDKSEYLRTYSGLNYLQYNELLIEIGKSYQVRSHDGSPRPMTPSEVDMALYMFDKLKGEAKPPLEPKETKKRKIDQIMAILSEIANDVYDVAKEDWAIKTKKSGWLKGSADKLMREMKLHAAREDLDGIFTYYQNALSDSEGRQIGGILREKGRKSLESEYERVKKIYYNP